MAVNTIFGQDLPTEFHFSSSSRIIFKRFYFPAVHHRKTNIRIDELYKWVDKWFKKFYYEWI